jgi:glyoxylase-like metal-dependent hydrolase (beta-lactamase superfamily II)
MDHPICVTCGAQFPASEEQPAHCPICEDDRQYIGLDGQRWTTLTALRQGHHNTFTELAPGITAIRTAPEFAIAQHAQLIQTPAGNVLWDCISLIDDATVSELRRRGGLAAIAISHPHFYTSMVEWSRAFGGVPIHLHASNRQWVMRPDDAIRYWDGETHEILPGVTLIRCGGHFPGSTVLHWAAGADGQGALFTGDTIMVVPDRRYVSFMYSFPNLIPLDEATVRSIVAAVEPYAFARIFGSWPGRIVQQDGRQAVRTSAERYIAHLRGDVTRP